LPPIAVVCHDEKLIDLSPQLRAVESAFA